MPNPPWYARLTTFLFGWWWVWTLDGDGAIRCKRGWVTPWGVLMSKKIYGSIKLNRDGTVAGSTYVYRWRLACGKLPSVKEMQFND